MGSKFCISILFFWGGGGGGGGFKKINIFGGVKILWIIFGVITNWTIFRGHFYAFYGLFLSLGTEWGYFLGFLKLQIFF